MFVLQCDFRPQGGAPQRDFYRLSIMDFLENRHATKDIFGSLQDATRITCGEDSARNHMRWGFGSTIYGQRRPEAALMLDTYRIRDSLMLTSDSANEADRVFCDEVSHQLTVITPE